MPCADDFPAIVIDHLETPSPLNPLGLKGVGESGTLPVPAVVASAVEDALGALGLRSVRVGRLGTLQDAEAHGTRGLRALEAARLSFLRDVEDEKACTDGPGVQGVMRL